MSKTDALLEHLGKQLPAGPGRALLLGPLSAARALELPTGLELLVGDDTAPAVRLARRRGDLALVRCAPGALPLCDGALSALVAVACLGRSDPRQLLAEWTRTLRPGGKLLLVEDIVWRPGHLLARLRGRRQVAFPPEDLTALLINAGFVSIGQEWPGSMACVVTAARTMQW